MGTFRLILLTLAAAAVALPQTLTPGNYARLGGGVFASNDCVKFNAQGRIVSAGAACGSGSGSSVTSTNVGSGTFYWFKQKTDNTLEFYTGAVASPITISGPTSNVFTIACPTCVTTGGSYANPSWVTSLAYAKITGVPAFENALTFSAPFSRVGDAISLSLGSANQLLGMNSGGTAWENKTLAVGSSGTDFAVAHSSGTITLNLPTASGTNRGALSSADWTTFNAKQSALSNSSGLRGALSDETGTGLAVFNASPTLDLPLFGVYSIGSNLPAAGTPNRIALIINGATADDCTSGGGSYWVICVDNGTVWVHPGGGGGGGGSGTVNSSAAGYFTYYASSGTAVSGLSRQRFDSANERIGMFDSGGTERVRFDLATGLPTFGMGITTGWAWSIGNSGDTAASSMTIYSGDADNEPSYVRLLANGGNDAYLFPCGGMDGALCLDSTTPGAQSHNFVKTLLNTTCTDAGSNDAYACNLPVAITAYQSGATYEFVANTSNTDDACIGFNSLTCTEIRKWSSGSLIALSTGDICAAQPVQVRYNGTYFVLMTPPCATNSGSGTVTSVALTMPAEFSVSGSPVTSTGTLAVTKANQSANQVFAGPTSGGAAAPAFRALVAADMPTSVRAGAVNFTLDGGGSAITTGAKGWVRVPYAGTITSVETTCDQTGSIVVDIWKDTYANFPPTDADSITASAPPTVSSAIKAQDTTLTDWTTTINAGDYLRINVDSASTVTYCVLAIQVAKD